MNRVGLERADRTFGGVARAERRLTANACGVCALNRLCLEAVARALSRLPGTERGLVADTCCVSALHRGRLVRIGGTSPVTVTRFCLVALHARRRGATHGFGWFVVDDAFALDARIGIAARGRGLVARVPAGSAVVDAAQRARGLNGAEHLASRLPAGVLDLEYDYVALRLVFGRGSGVLMTAFAGEVPV